MMHITTTKLVRKMTKDTVSSVRASFCLLLSSGVFSFLGTGGLTELSSWPCLLGDGGIVVGTM